MPHLELNSEAPDFDAVATDGSLFSLKKHLKEHDAWHLLVFFRGSWCPVCNETLKELNESIDYFTKLNTHIVAISGDHIDDLKRMAEEHRFSFPVLGDKDDIAARSFGVMRHTEDAPYEDHGEHIEPAVFLMDNRGRILYIQIQTSPFGRPSPHDLGRTIKYIKENLK